MQSQPAADWLLRSTVRPLEHHMLYPVQHRWQFILVAEHLFEMYDLAYELIICFRTHLNRLKLNHLSLTRYICLKIIK